MPMLSTQQILQSVMDMQANAQQALPVIPNNGNPAGANNMPHNNTTPLPMRRRAPNPSGGYDGSGIIPPHMRQQTPGQGQGSTMAERYPWLKPSSSMDNIRGYLSSRRGMFGQRPNMGQPNHPQPMPQPQQQGQGITMAVDPSLHPVDYPAMPIRAEIM